jgi:hypothetical protein
MGVGGTEWRYFLIGVGRWARGFRVPSSKLKSGGCDDLVAGGGPRRPRRVKNQRTGWPGG